MGQEDRIYASKVIRKQHYHGNIIHSNHGNGTQPNKDFKVFKTHRVNHYILTLLLTMVLTKLESINSQLVLQLNNQSAHNQNSYRPA